MPEIKRNVGLRDHDDVTAKRVRNSNFVEDVGIAACAVGDLIVDITADQVPDVAEPLIVASQSPWHVKFHGEVEHVADYEIYDERTRASLDDA